MRYFLQLSYKGTNYHGWQIQKNALSVQELINNALTTLLRHPVETLGAGRTDSGVHATYFICHFDTNEEIKNEIQFLLSLNGILPNDIAIQKVFKVNTKSHARFTATSRTYHYKICLHKDPFHRGFAWLLYQNLNWDKILEASNILLEYQDFTSFSKVDTDVFTNNCKIMKSSWKFDNNIWTYEVKADRFLRNMVRAIVGTLIQTGREKYTVDKFRKIIESKNRASAGASAPADGLYLVNIEYPTWIHEID